jgi:mono/diheme cytochrome c family protein/DNA uptake protein ComE-like DNA-binding protein
MGGVKRVIRLALCTAVALTCTTWAQDIGSTYAANCAHCHGADGRGNTVLGRAMKIRDLRSPEVRRLSEDELLVILSKGGDGGRMPGFQKKLGAETVRQLATYVRDIELQPVPILQTKRTANLEAGSDNGDVKSVYSAKCSHCHGADGAGNTVLGRTLKLRDMRSAEGQKFSDDEIVAIIASGADGGKMPGFRKKLGPEMVEQLASYVRGLAGKSPVEVTKKAVSAETVSETAPSEPVKPAIQANGKTTSLVQPEKQAQPQEHTRARETHKASPLAKLSSAIIPARKTGPSNPPVDLNSAGKETLMTLPGITEADAGSIIAGRPYKSSLQFKTRMIVSPETYAKVSGRVVAKKPARTTQQPAPDKGAK